MSGSGLKRGSPLARGVLAATSLALLAGCSPPDSRIAPPESAAPSTPPATPAVQLGDAPRLPENAR